MLRLLAMKKRWVFAELFAGVVWTFAGMMLAGTAVVDAQTATAPVEVRESGARAILAGDSIRLQLPFAAPATQGGRAAVWTLSPTGAKSAETAVEFAAGARLVSASLPWPRDEKGNKADEIGWYRIGYRIEAENAAAVKGVLSIGAITPNLLTLRLALEERPVAGKPLTVRVYAVNPVTGKSFRGVWLEGTLEYDVDAKEGAKAVPHKVVRAATTGLEGEAALVVPITGAPGDSATFTVTGTLVGEDGARSSASIDADIDIIDRETVRVESDKMLHKPGETVHLRALVLDDTGRAAAGKALKLTIEDSEAKDLLEEPLVTNRFGIASYDWKTGPQLAPGNYHAQFDVDGSKNIAGPGWMNLEVRRYDLPEFAVSAALDRGFYLDGQTPVVHLHAGYLFGKAVAAGTVRVARPATNRWNPVTKKMVAVEKAEQTATLDEHGDADVKLDVADEFADLKSSESERYRDVQYRAYVTDASTGRTEPLNFTVRLTRNPVHIYLNRMDGNDHEGDYIVSTTYADGAPAACRVTLDWMDAESHGTRAAMVTTSRYGLARVHLRFPSAGDDLKWKVRLTARDAEQRTSVLDDTVNAGEAKSMWISVGAALMKPGQNIEAVVHGPPGEVIDVDAVSAQGLISHHRVQMMHATEPFTVTMGDDFRGVVTLMAYSMNGDAGNGFACRGLCAYKSVLYPEDRELKLKLTGLQASYTPGAEVDAGVDVRAAGGFAVPGALGISVADAAVEQRAVTEEDANQRWFGWNWWRITSNIGGVTMQDIEKTDMSKPVSDDMQLVAEAGLQHGIPFEMNLESEDYEDSQNAYEAGIKTQLKPVGDAILAARPQQLPATLDGVRAIADAAQLDPALLLDPWQTPYKVEVSRGWNTVDLGVLSAGPDKRFGTDDDFSVVVVQRNFFALPGERLSKILEDRVTASEPLPGTVDELKRMARAGGLDLDATFDPDGNAFQYQIRVGPRWYDVQVYGHEVMKQENGRLAGAAVWTSPYIDYFSHTEARMEAAINAWTDAGKVFPGTEAEARAAFTAAGIDFDALRDPLGRPFQLVTNELMSYTRVERVKAGGSLEEESKPVTHLYRAIQVLRAPSEPNDKVTNEVVAQFLHPVSEQSGSDAKPGAVNGGTFKGNTGAIGGTVTDATGAVVVGATVTVKTVFNATVATVKSMVNGMYLAGDLDGGFYTVEVAAGGFETCVVRQVHVAPVALTTLDVELTVGGTSETVTVTDAPPMLETTDATLGGTISNELYSSLPLSMNGGPRDPTAFQYLMPGVQGKAAKLSAASVAQAKVSEPMFTPRLRHVFEETAYWAPSLETTANGRASLHFTLPDSLTTWKLHTLASTTDGRIGVLDRTFRTFQPLFVDADLPQVLTVGDEIGLPVNLRNYMDHSVSLPVTVKPAEWLTLLTPAKVEANVAAGGSVPVAFGFKAKSAVEAGALRIDASNGHEGDAVERTVMVHPDGEPRAVTAAGLLTQDARTLTLELPADTIQGSIHAEVRLYPNLGAHVLHAMKAVLERPYGCAEQTISSAYPSLLYLKLAKGGGAQNAADDPVATEAQTYLQLGYDRLKDYFDASGGLTYWGGRDHNPDPALTAYGIEFLSEASAYIPVDRSEIIQAVDWLIKNQKADGSWAPRYGGTSAELNLYIAEVLALPIPDGPFGQTTSPDLRDRMTHAVSGATAWAASSAAAVHDAYANALRLRLAEMRPGDGAAVGRLRAELASTAAHDREGAHWTPGVFSPFYGWGHAGELETTAVVLGALRQGAPTGAESGLLNEALFFLMRNEDRYGCWFSGQATVRVLQALLPVAIAQMKAGTQTQSFALTVNGVQLSGANAESLRTDPRLMTAPRTVDLTAMLRPGVNTLVFSAAGDASLVSAEATASFYVPWQGEAATSKTQTGSDAGLDFGYSCAAEDAHVGKAMECSVTARRFGSQSYGMMLAEVGLPPGAEVDRASLARLLDAGTISRYELQPDRIVFYLWPGNAAGTKFDFAMTPRYAIKAKAAEATLSDYYNPELRVVLPPEWFSVTGQSQK
jgi:hypothetical protein